MSITKPSFMGLDIAPKAQKPRAKSIPLNKVDVAQDIQDEMYVIDIRPDSPSSQTPLLSRPHSQASYRSTRSPTRSPLRNTIPLVDGTEGEKSKTQTDKNIALRSSTTISHVMKSQPVDDNLITPTFDRFINTSTPPLPPENQSGAGGFQGEPKIHSYFTESIIVSILSVCCYCVLPISLIALWFASKLRDEPNRKTQKLVKVLLVMSILLLFILWISVLIVLGIALRPI